MQRRKATSKTLFAVGDLTLGGIQRVNTVVANELDSLGFDITLLTAVDRPDKYEVTCTFKRGTKKYTKFTNFKLRLGSRLTKRRRGGIYKHALLNELHQTDYDTIVLNPDFYFFVPDIKKSFPKLKIYLWMHNNYDIYVNLYYKRYTAQLFKCAALADGIICLEHYSQNKWLAHNPNSFVIYNPCTIETKGQVSNLSNHTISVTSRISIMMKGLDYLLDIARTIPEDWTIQIAGDGDDTLSLQKLIKNANLEKKIILRGALYGNELLQHYLNSSIFISTSRWEGFALAPLEAMKCGLPICTFDLPCFEELSQHGKYFPIAPLDDISKFETNLLEFINDSHTRREYSKLSLKRIDDFSVETICQQWINKVIQ
ncbi:glycosyltransferase [Bifidobacterium choloepi]|uniref:Glycosyltransferase family 4 protein n=1 Tax=Bifidobacterium choloepi TaxID=2614131 RepID=A0A6I5N1J3_9BIFI|nr:glycosyltransferase [Bifidobacterium choloepi]NEG70346.1 glycosyltransferase family 4 protein [Bifidobacterium choloepi]